MVQTLEMESAWEKTVSDQDRELIMRTFAGLTHTRKQDFAYTYLRHDFNHRGALLVIALIHNYDRHKRTFIDHEVQCCDKSGTIIAAESFTIPVQISANTSMPWTFIFPAGSYGEEAAAANELVVTS